MRMIQFTLSVLLILAAWTSPARAEKAVGVSQAVADAVHALPDDLKTPNRYALIVGASYYEDARIPPLPACSNDAKALYQVLTDPSAGFFPKENVTLLTDEQVTRVNIVNAFDQLSRVVDPHDLVVIFFSGHGATDSRERAYWVMADTRIDSLRATALPESDVTELLGEIITTRLVTLIDACYSAATAELSKSKALIDIEKIYPQFRGEGRIAITASKGDQLSVVIKNDSHPGRGYSAFAWHVVEGLKGQADLDRDGVVTANELWNYVKDRTEITARTEGGNQQPQLKGQIGSRFLFTVDATTLLAKAQHVQTQIARLTELFLQEQINSDHYEDARKLLTTPPNSLNRRQRARRQVYVDLVEARLDPKYLDSLLGDTPPMSAATPPVTPSAPAAPQPVRPTKPQPLNDAKKSLQKLWRFYLEKSISLQDYKLAEALYHANPEALDPTDHRLMQVCQNVADGKDLPRYLSPLLEAVEPAAERMSRAEDVIRRSEIFALMQKARANDNFAKGHEALKILERILQLDPNHAPAKKLQRKISDYYPPTQVGDTWTNTLDMAFAYIPAGEFVMGSPGGESGRGGDESRHKVRITRHFLMSKTEVTQKQWMAIMGNNPSYYKGDNLPVEQASWYDAEAFCIALSKKEGRTYRLPTESEWEYACRAGTVTAFNTGSTLGFNQANIKGVKGATLPVASFEPNAWGLYDMHGNVWEWCSDWYGGYPWGSVTDPQGPRHGKYKTIRGGSWRSTARACRSADRYPERSPKLRYSRYGFRIVRELDEN